MIEISNEELMKALNLWTETEDWALDTSGKLCCGCWAQRMKEGRIILPTDSEVDKAAHALVNFMLKERIWEDGKVLKYNPEEINPVGTYTAKVEIWEKRFGDKPQDDQPKVVDHSIPVRYDHLISTEELVKRAQERWPDDGWQPYEGGGGVPADNVCDNRKGKARYWYLEGGYVASIKLQPPEQRAKLLALISEAQETVERPVCQDIPTDPRTKAERFYAFLATPRPDISPGLWGLEREPQAPVRGGDEGWARKDVGCLTWDGWGHSSGFCTPEDSREV